jgi:hypothetical protein
VNAPWIALIAALFAVRALIAHGGEPLGAYDEGLLFTDAFLMSNDRAIYRDFYVNYPPGILQIVRGVMALHLPAIWTTRLLALGVRVATAVAAGRLVRKARGEAGVCAYSAAAILVLQEGIDLRLYAYPLAVLMATIALLSWPAAHARRYRPVAAGALLGLVSYFRHDLFTYFLLCAAALEALSWVVRRGSLFTDSWIELRRLATGLVAMLALLWIPVLIAAGWYRPLHDLVLDPARLMMPGRVLPLPPLFEPVEIATLDLTLPAIFAERTRLCVAVDVLGTCLAALAVLVRLRDPSRRADIRLAALLTIFGLSTLPQALQRVDHVHAAFGLPLVVAALAAGVGPRVSKLLLVLAFLPWFSTCPEFVRLDAAKQLWSQRDDARFFTPRQQEIAAFVRSQTAPGEPVFVGCASHVRIIISPVELLYLTQRLNATRYVQFDPGTVTGVQGQKEMIADLERTRPRLAVRAPVCAWDEPNASRIPGASLLDEYLALHYAKERDVGGFAVWRRRGTPP